MLTDDPLNATIVLSLLAVVSLCTVTDILENRIPNIILLPALLLAFVCHSLVAGIPGFVDCLLGLVLGLALLFPFYVTGGTSAGDVKLLGVVGALLGVEGAIVAGVATLVFGGALGILYIVWRVIRPKLMMYTAQLMHLSWSTGPSLNRATDTIDPRSTYFPYAPAIFCGTCFSLWQLGYFSKLVVF